MTEAEKQVQREKHQSYIDGITVLLQITARKWGQVEDPAMLRDCVDEAVQLAWRAAYRNEPDAIKTCSEAAQSLMMRETKGTIQ